MSDSIHRRRFIGTSAAGTAAVGLSLSSLQALADSSPNNKIVVGVMGLSRGASLADSYARMPNVEVKYVCDIDSIRAGNVAERVKGVAGKAPQAIGDFRKILDDKDVDALVCAAPNHWHAPATILGCSAGKHVYVEKPCSHNHLWLGPSAERPYSEGVHPFQWRRFWDYGTGSLGDFGCHYMDLAHWALKLRHPTSLVAEGPQYDPVSTPAWCIAHYEYPQRGELPPVKLTWYDSGKQPSQLKALIARGPKDQDGKSMGTGGGQLFIGEKGQLWSNYFQRCLLPTEDFTEFKPPEPSIPNSIGHHAEWLNAIKNGGPTTCNFNYSGALTEAVLLGTVAYRSGEKIEWDAKNLKVTNSEKAQQFIHKEYRKGWTL